MDELKKFYDRLVDLWVILLGLGSGIVAIWRIYCVHGTRLRRAMLLSDAVYSYFGPKATKLILAEFQEHKREGVVRESRLQLVEKKLDLAVYLCSDTGSCEWVNVEFAELLGIERISCLGLGWLEGVEANERTQVYNSWIHAVSHHLPYEYRYTIHNRRSGKKSQCLSYAYPHITSAGVLLCYVGYLVAETEVT